MAKRKKNQEKDSVYFLKLVLFFLLGALWLRINIGSDDIIGLPVGLAIGLAFASHDHFQIDRKIEYAVLIISAALSAYVPIVGFWV